MTGKIFGKWKLESSENFDEYMQAVGQCYFLCIYVLNLLFNNFLTNFRSEHRAS